MTTERIKTIRDALLPLDDAWDALNSLLAELDATRAREQTQQSAWNMWVHEVIAARMKDAESLERTQAALDKAVETLHGVSRGCEDPRSEHVASIGRFVSEGLAEVKRLRNKDRNAELAAKNAEITRLSAVLDWALDAHAAGKRREDILATTLANVMHDRVNHEPQ